MTPIVTTTPITTKMTMTAAMIAVYAVWWWRLIAFGGHTF